MCVPYHAYLGQLRDKKQSYKRWSRKTPVLCSLVLRVGPVGGGFRSGSGQDVSHYWFRAVKIVLLVKGRVVKHRLWPRE